MFQRGTKGVFAIYCKHSLICTGAISTLLSRKASKASVTMSKYLVGASSNAAWVIITDPSLSGFKGREQSTSPHPWVQLQAPLMQVPRNAHGPSGDIPVVDVVSALARGHCCEGDKLHASTSQSGKEDMKSRDSSSRSLIVCGGRRRGSHAHTWEERESVLLFLLLDLDFHGRNGSTDEIHGKETEILP